LAFFLVVGLVGYFRLGLPVIQFVVVFEFCP